MGKSVSNETRAKKIIRMVNASGMTWEEISEALGLSIKYIQLLARKHYKTETGYKKLLDKARVNKKAKAKVKAVRLITPVSEAESKKEEREVIVTETGYLLCTGASKILSEELDVYIPFFCVKELEKLSRDSAVAEEVLKMHYSTERMTSINLKGREVLFEEPRKSVKDRTMGVVALCCYLWSMDYRVRLLTNSKEIQELAEMQGIDISVVKVS